MFVIYYYHIDNGYGCFTWPKCDLNLTYLSECQWLIPGTYNEL